MGGARPDRGRAPQEGLRARRDERDEVGALQQERREQEALDAQLDAALHAGAREVRSGSETGWPAPPIE